jgi:hypothetical protein
LKAEEWQLDRKLRQLEMEYTALNFRFMAFHHWCPKVVATNRKKAEKISDQLFHLSAIFIFSNDLSIVLWRISQQNMALSSFFDSASVMSSLCPPHRLPKNALPRTTLTLPTALPS